MNPTLLTIDGIVLEIQSMMMMNRWQSFDANIAAFFRPSAYEMHKKDVSSSKRNKSSNLEMSRMLPMKVELIALV